MHDPDIMMTGRALFGHHPAKGQQLDDHYFGSIPERNRSLYERFRDSVFGAWDTCDYET